MAHLTESTVEEAALAWLEAAGWQIARGPDIATDQPRAEQADYSEVILQQRLHDAPARLNPDLPAEAREDALRRLTRPEGVDLIQRNRALHRLLLNGVTVEQRTHTGEVRRRGSSTSTPRPTTTGSPSTSSAWSSTSTAAGPTWCCSSTACRWRWSN